MYIELNEAEVIYRWCKFKSEISVIISEWFFKSERSARTVINWFHRDLKVYFDTSTFIWYGLAGLYTVAYESAWNPEAMCEQVTLRHR